MCSVVIAFFQVINLGFIQPKANKIKRAEFEKSRKQESKYLARIEDEVQTDNFEVHGFPCSQHPYNPMFDVQKQLPVYTKTPKSKSQFCAGYYIICFEKGWRKAYCPKMITLSRYKYRGPMKTKLEMQQVLNNAVKEFQNTNTNN